MNRTITMLCIIACYVNVAFSQSKVGTTAANFLTIPVGARASSMGGTFVAVANDVTAAFWNPGGLSRLAGNEINTTHAEWLIGTDLNWLGMAFKFDNSALGISFNQLDYGEEEITTEFQQDGTGQKWDAQDVAVSLSYSRNLTDKFSIGGSTKYITERIWNESASAFALDIGLLYTSQINKMRIGMNIANFGNEMKLFGKDLLQPVDIDPGNSGNNENIVGTLSTDSWPLPLTFTVGIAMDVVETEDWVMTIATDAIHPNNQNPNMNFGTEMTWNEFFSIRTGYNSLFEDDPEEGFTAGFGVQYGFDTFSLKMDYSYNDFGVFKGISRYSLAIGY